MRNMIKLGATGVLLAVGLVQANAATNYWVQPANVAWTVYGANDFKATVPTKVLINLMSKVTITNYAAGTVTSTTTVTTNKAVVVNTNAASIVESNAVLSTLVPTNAATLTYTNSYVVTIGAASYTNNLNFTNPIVFTLAGTNPVTYTFNNQVTVGSNATAFPVTDLFTVTNAPVGTNAATTTNLVAPYITAALQTNGQFALSYSTFVTTYLTNTVSVTNYPSSTTPDFSTAKSAKLYYVTPIANNVPMAPLFWVVTGSGKNAVTYDVSGFFNRGAGATVKASEKTSKNVQYAFSELMFATPDGKTSLDALGLDTQTLKLIKSKKPAVTTTVPVLSASKAVDAGDGQVSSSLYTGNVVLSGTIAISSGKLQ